MQGSVSLPWQRRQGGEFQDCELVGLDLACDMEYRVLLQFLNVFENDNNKAFFLVVMQKRQNSSR